MQKAEAEVEKAHAAGQTEKLADNQRTVRVLRREIVLVVCRKPLSNALSDLCWELWKVQQAVEYICTEAIAGKTAREGMRVLDDRRLSLVVPIKRLPGAGRFLNRRKSYAFALSRQNLQLDWLNSSALREKRYFHFF